MPLDENHTNRIYIVSTLLKEDFWETSSTPPPPPPPKPSSLLPVYVFSSFLQEILLKNVKIYKNVKQSLPKEYTITTTKNL